MQMNSRWSQDTKYSSSWSSSGSTLPSDIQDRLTIKSQRDLHITVEKSPRQPQCPLPAGSTSMVSITNNNYYIGPESFCTVKPHRSLSCPLKPVEVNNYLILHKKFNSYWTHARYFIYHTCIFISPCALLLDKYRSSSFFYFFLHITL